MFSKNQLLWAKDKYPCDESVSFESFVQEHNLIDQRLAEDTFIALIGSDEIRMQRRKKMQELFDMYKAHNADIFWSARRAQVSSEVTSNDAVVDLQKAALSKSKNQYSTISASERSTANMSPLSLPCSVALPTQSRILANKSTSSSSSLSSPITLSSEGLPTNSANDAETPTIAVPPCGASSSPFYDLITYVFLAAKEKDPTLPSTTPDGLSKLHLEMYQAALEELRLPGPVVDKKDAMVLLSTIINTVAPSGRCFSVSKQIQSASILPGLDTNSDSYNSVKSVLSELLRTLHPQIEFDRHCLPEFGLLKKRVWTMLCDTPERTAAYTTLQIMNQVILWIELGMFTTPTSEQVYVTAWSLIFNILLLDTTIRAIP
ncbi:hypothetical protein EDD21DRAFT_421725 [Dissophora ornata]|nr:hypothetical protein EDD21DRAFT_421725 [Dissophora ornata]